MPISRPWVCHVDVRWGSGPFNDEDDARPRRNYESRESVRNCHPEPKGGIFFASIRALRRFLFRILIYHDKRSAANLMALGFMGEDPPPIRHSSKIVIDVLIPV